LPGRFELLASLLMPFRKKLLPQAPSAVNVLWRSLVAHQRYDILPTTPLDMVMRPPIPPDIDVTDFDRHSDIFAASYLWAKNTIAALEAEGSPALEAILSSGRPPARRSRPAAMFPSEVLTS
jgi:NTE family protein